MKNIRLIFQSFPDRLDKFLDPITSYRLVLYYLLVIIVWAVVAAVFHKVPFKWYDLVLSMAWLFLVCRGFNWLASRLLNVPSNKDSDFISALILALILSPAASFRDYLILALAGAVAMFSKYLLVIGKRHIFNPAALGAFSAGLLFHHYASWWVGMAVIIPVVVAGGLLIMRKMKRFTMVLIFLLVYFLIIVAKNYTLGASPLWQIIWLSISATPLLFFSYIMLSEPQTSPPDIGKYAPYAILVAVLYSNLIFHLTPEAALLIGNIFAYLMAPQKRLELEFIERHKEADGIYSFKFKPSGKLKFKAGQYMEWTIPKAGSDNRGNRRYLTIASAPSEKELLFTTKMPQKMSSFKKELMAYETGDEIIASRPSGSFTLPKDIPKKLTFIAGGVGITPFRSIIKYLIDADIGSSVVLLYAAASANEFAFKDLFKRADAIGLKTFYTITSDDVPQGWHGLAGPIDEILIKKVLPDYKDRTFYISGPYGFVQAVRKSLLSLGLKNSRIKTDYFPGYG